VSRLPQLTSWQQQLASRFRELPTPVVAVLALYSFGVVSAHVCGLTTVALFLSKSRNWSFLATRKRLSEFYKEAHAKSGVKQGQKRRDFDVTTCFPSLLRWILALWQGQRLPLAIDVTNLGDRFHVLCVSVVVRGVAIPVAWKVLLGGVKDPWNPHWQKLLQQLKPAVPDGWIVLVLSDRGLESAALFRFITTLDWHPLMRVKRGGKFRPKGWKKFYALGDLVRKVGSSFCDEGRAYVGEKLPCTLLGRWDAGYSEPWLLLTDLPPEAGDAIWYSLRSWIEQGFKILKGGGWDWQKTRMEDPERVERLWLVLAVATLWVVALGVEEEVREEVAAENRRLERQLRESQEEAAARQERARARQEKQRQAQAARRERLEKRRAARKTARGAKKAKQLRRKSASKARVHRVWSAGLAVLKAVWEKGATRLPQQLSPEPWPQSTHATPRLTEEEFLAQQT
jgi:hypothetical protein